MRRAFFLGPVGLVACAAFGSASDPPPGVKGDPADGGSDAATTAPGPNADAAPDAPVDPGPTLDGALSFCKTVETPICLDFATSGGAPFPNWQQDVVGGGRPLVVVSGAMFSSLRDAATFPGTSAARLRRLLDHRLKNPRLELEIKLSSVTPATNHQLTLAELLCCDQGTEDCNGVVVNVREGLEVGLAAVGLPPPDVGPVLQTDAWTSLVLQASLTAVPPKVSLTINGDPVNEINVATCAPNQDFWVRVGLATATQQVASAQYDDIAFTEQ